MAAVAVGASSIGSPADGAHRDLGVCQSKPIPCTITTVMVLSGLKPEDPEARPGAAPATAPRARQTDLGVSSSNFMFRSLILFVVGLGHLTK